MVSDGRPPTSVSEWLVAAHIDAPLLLAVVGANALGLTVLYSASGQSADLVLQQGVRLGLGIAAMIGVAQVPPQWFRIAAPWALAATAALLGATLVLGDTSMGAQRWLDLGVVRFQPSEVAKILVPLAVAAFLHARPLPPTLREVGVCVVIVAVPAALVAAEPDLGSAVLIAAAGACALFFAGLRWRFIGVVAVLGLAALPLVWFSMHDYQQQRVLTFLNPARDPLGAGYHILQSKIAIGSGGVFGQGWLDGSQARLSFLPEADTDFIFAVYAEETGFLGVLGLIGLYAAIVARGLMIAVGGRDTFARLAAASLSSVFFVYAFINMGMVSGILPVVGVPLPLVSYGGTSMVMLLASFGVLMSIQTHREMLGA